MSARRGRMTRSILPVPTARLLELAENDLKNKAPIFEAMGEVELAELSQRNAPKLINDRSIFDIAARRDWPNGEKQIVGGDYISDHWKLHDEKAFALFEALYGAANSYDIQYYLAAPLIDVIFDFDFYFELWKAGADIALTEENILVFRNDDLLTQQP